MALKIKGFEGPAHLLDLEGKGNSVHSTCLFLEIFAEYKISFLHCVCAHVYAYTYIYICVRVEKEREKSLLNWLYIDLNISYLVV